MGNGLAFARDYDAAIDVLLRALELDPYGVSGIIAENLQLHRAAPLVRKDPGLLRSNTNLSYNALQ